MVYGMRRELSSNISALPDFEVPAFNPKVPLITPLQHGGLAQIRACRGGSRTRFAITCLGLAAQSDPPSPSLSGSREVPYGVWVSDEGYLYPPAFHDRFPLERLLLIKTPRARDTWQVGLEAVQSGLFQWVLLRPGDGCPDIFLRKMQLAAGRTHCRVLLLTEKPLPHWTLKTSFEAQAI